MHIGIQTISWGPRPRSVPQMLAEVKEAGYDGVEFMQDPKVLGEPEELFQMLQEYRLSLVGIAGGSLTERVTYAQRVKEMVESRDLTEKTGSDLQYDADTKSLAVPYVYIDDWQEDQHVSVLHESGVVLALHPHMFKPVQTADEAAHVLDRHPELRFLPDTAHLVVAGQNPVEVITRNLGRLAAVHLKDWTAEFGRSYQFYSRGFIELGEGSVNVKEVVEMLVHQKYKGWLLVEQDTRADPFASAKKSRQWLLSETGV